MNKHYLFVHPIVYFILSTFIEVHYCDGHHLKNFVCFSYSLSYQIFYVNFYFSSRAQTQERLTHRNFASDNIDFDPTRKTVLIIHGLTPKLYIDDLYHLRDELRNWDDVNIIYVDWEEGCSSTLLYNKAVLNTKYVAIKIGELFGNFIDAWQGTNKSVENWGPVHFIGLSLGAHIAGQAAQLLKQNYDYQVDRITGLDPAGPCFYDPNSPLRLRKSNARFVDVIHTDGAVKKNSRLGLSEPIGHVDFYVNGGSFQPGCQWFTPHFRTKRAASIFKLGYHLIIGKGTCHHLRSLKLFSESLTQAVSGQCTFWAHPWNLKYLSMNYPPDGIDSCNKQNCIEMGINADLYNSRGVYYVATTARSPYCYY